MDAQLQPITMPKWGMTMTEGRLSAWLVKEGERIATGQEIMEVETEKITNVVEGHVSGLLRRIVVEEGATAPVGALLAVVAETSVPDSEVDAFVAGYAERAGAAGDDADAYPTPRVVEAGPHQLNVLSIGDGDATPVVLIHGFGGDGGTWLFTQDALAKDRPVHVLDLPAHGGSAPTVPSGKLDELAEAVVAALDALGIARAHLVGHSLGGAVALSVAASAPDRVASLGLLAPAGLGGEISSDYIDGFLAADRRKPMKEVLSRLFADPDAMSAEMVENVLRFKRLDGVPEALGAIARNLASGGRQAIDLRDALAATQAPVLAVWGEKDRVIPAAQADGLPANIKVERVADAGHMPMMEAAAAVNRMLAAHLAGADR
ncbi:MULTISPECIES: acetoin dehydrogenase dihydrolipoyllysine-residue acetyltransferase subunit [unclassified Mesorhizobium]|uniref:acetoin dehydrogenase dihydrolipoyllysine-residue acetyltransferase subunit n=1 Tax=unclassified Mesorhizobium TaxID=325217 RepID=UPI00095A28AB|nr:MULTISPECIES: acetoin dehydrogenase dihydrolipoyllysine-residue acetyltransferase subunit [unclassified Mesorhizobium]MBN9258731.1 acetoin dehydrogenase dihydrolipoyllysine-residue acetyltransferase subunit [Mesorhizobium sp.]OJX72642.1 MAG: acetoin dehydrogenase dihydrolipoyllysine-residue acetyltransferase subunit [Mesorhizobium sp. 65-26]